MTNEPESLEALVRRLIREQLLRGEFGKLVQLQQVVAERIQTMGIPTAENFGTTTVTGTIATSLPKLQTSMAAHVDAKANAKAIEAASPEFASEMQRRPEDAMLMLNLFMALMQVVQTMLGLYQTTHSTPATRAR